MVMKNPVHPGEILRQDEINGFQMQQQSGHQTGVKIGRAHV